MHKVEHSRVYIFYKEKRFFANLHGNIKLCFSKSTSEYKVISFSEVKAICRESKGYGCNELFKVCAITNCSTGYKTGQKKASFHFHEDQELKRKRKLFWKDWLPTAHSVICIDHFEEKFIKRGKKCQLLCCGKYIQYLQS